LRALDPGLYIVEDFSGTPSGWTLSGAFETGLPRGGIEPEPIGGACLATTIGGTYPPGMTFTSDYAQTPEIDLRGARAPVLEFDSWLQTSEWTWEDGVTLQITNDGGERWTAIRDVSPAYNGSSGVTPTWRGTMTPWRGFTADLTPFADQTVSIRFAAYSSPWTTPAAGWYVDNVMIVEAD
jgi:hypothetical protein